MAYGPINVSPGTFRVARWKPGFDPICLRTTTQVWVKLYGIPLEFRKGQNLLNIAAAIGTPLRLDQSTINLCIGLYARILIDIDVSRSLPQGILASLKVQTRNINVNFSVSVYYEQLLCFCNFCRSIGHTEEECKNMNMDQYQKWKELAAKKSVALGKNHIKHRGQIQHKEAEKNTTASQEKTNEKGRQEVNLPLERGMQGVEEEGRNNTMEGAMENTPATHFQDGSTHMEGRTADIHVQERIFAAYSNTDYA